MRRTDREITDLETMLKIIGACDVLRLGLADAACPYVVPVNFGYEYKDGQLTLYFHGAAAGRKFTLLKKGGPVAFEMDTDHQLVTGPVACSYSFRYHSVLGEAVPEILTEREEALHALEKIMEHYTGRADFPMKEQMLARVCVVRLKVTAWSCKGH